jgi:hypothetical protein
MTHGAIISARSAIGGTNIEAGPFHLKRILLWLIIAATVIAFVLHRSRSGSRLNVEPHAREVNREGKAAVIAQGDDALPVQKIRSSDSRCQRATSIARLPVSNTRRT